MDLIVGDGPLSLGCKKLPFTYSFTYATLKRAPKCLTTLGMGTIVLVSSSPRTFYSVIIFGKGWVKTLNSNES